LAAGPYNEDEWFYVILLFSGIACHERKYIDLWKTLALQEQKQATAIDPFAQPWHLGRAYLSCASMTPPSANSAHVRRFRK
jgi:hypothetical protein